VCFADADEKIQAQAGKLQDAIDLAKLEKLNSAAKDVLLTASVQDLQTPGASVHPRAKRHISHVQELVRHPPPAVYTLERGSSLDLRVAGGGRHLTTRREVSRRSTRTRTLESYRWSPTVEIRSRCSRTPPPLLLPNPATP
jgi:hypothetical protein